MSIWILQWDNYIHGVFESQTEAEEYVENRWGSSAYNIKIQEFKVGTAWSETLAKFAPL